MNNLSSNSTSNGTSIPQESILPNNRSKVCRSYVSNSQSLDLIMKKANEIIRKSKAACSTTSNNQPTQQQQQQQQLQGQQRYLERESSGLGLGVIGATTTGSLSSLSQHDESLTHHHPHPSNAPPAGGSITMTTIESYSKQVPMYLNSSLTIEESKHLSNYQTVCSPDTAVSKNSQHQNGAFSGSSGSGTAQAGGAFRALSSDKVSDFDCRRPNIQESEMREVSKQLIIPSIDSHNHANANVPANPTDLFFDNFESAIRISYMNPQTAAGILATAEQHNATNQVVKSLFSAFESVRQQETTQKQLDSNRNSNPSSNNNLLQQQQQQQQQPQQSYLVPKAFQQTTTVNPPVHSSFGSSNKLNQSSTGAPTADPVEALANSKQIPYITKQDQSSTHDLSKKQQQQQQPQQTQNATTMMMPPRAGTVKTSNNSNNNNNNHNALLPPQHPSLPSNKVVNLSYNTNHYNSQRFRHHRHSLNAGSNNNSSASHSNANNNNNNSFNQLNHSSSSAINNNNNNKENNSDAANNSVNGIPPLPMKQVSGGTSFLMSTPAASTSTAVSRNNNNGSIAVPQAPNHLQHGSSGHNNANMFLNYTPLGSYHRPRSDSMNGGSSQRFEQQQQQQQGSAIPVTNAGVPTAPVGSQGQQQQQQQQQQQLQRTRAGSMYSGNSHQPIVSLNEPSMNFEKMLTSNNNNNGIRGASPKGTTTTTTNMIASPMVIGNGSRSHSQSFSGQSQQQHIPMSKLLATKQSSSNSVLNSAMNMSSSGNSKTIGGQTAMIPSPSVPAKRITAVSRSLSMNK